MVKKTFKKTIATITIAGILISNTGVAYGALGDRALKKGMRHDDVMELQQELDKLGFFNFNEYTTYYGVVTEQAVKNFQSSVGLKVDGSFGQLTYRALIDSIEQGNSAVEDVQDTDSVESSESETNEDGIDTIIYERVLKKGVQGKDVKDLQNVLKYLGFLDIEETKDIFDDLTQEALIDFQHNYKIGVDGAAGPETIRTINRVLTGRIKKIAEPTRGTNRRSSIAIDIVNTARKYLGAKYKPGGKGPNSFDCSGFTQFIYKQFGINLPGSSVAQASVGTKVSRENLQIGDLLIFSNTYKAGPSHTGIYIGNGQLIHASTSTKGVIISDLNSNYYKKHFSYGRRVY